MRGDRIGPRGPWRAPRELVELLEAHDARALVEDLHEARLELARAAACAAFGIGWLALHVARAPGGIGVLVEVVLVELAVIGAAVLLVLEGHRTNATAYARARARTSKTIRWRNPDETSENGPPGPIRSGASTRGRRPSEPRTERLTARRQVGPIRTRARALPHPDDGGPR